MHRVCAWIRAAWEMSVEGREQYGTIIIARCKLNVGSSGPFSSRSAEQVVAADRELARYSSNLNETLSFVR